MVSVAEKNPLLVAEWDEENELSPDHVSYGSNRMIIWKGKCGHRWEASPKSRSGGEGCPYCAGKRVLIGFNDVKSLYPDLAAEWSPRNTMAADEVTIGSSKKVEWVCGSCGHTWYATVKNRTGGSGCPDCAGRIIKSGTNDFASLHPEAMLDWSEKNDADPDLKPERMAQFSNKRAWWKCHICGYEWMSLISDRARGSECPCCAGQVIVPGINDLLTKKPDIAMEWSEANGRLSPSDFSEKSRKMVWWTCMKCGRVWQASIYSRCAGRDRGCTFCSALASKEREASKLRKKRQEEQYDLHYEEIAVKKWIEDSGIKVMCDSDELIGIPVDYYFPEYKSVLILPKDFHNNYHGRKIQRAYNDLLRKSKVKLVRILDPSMEPYDDCICIRKKDDSREAFDAALAEAIKELVRD